MSRRGEKRSWPIWVPVPQGSVPRMMWPLARRQTCALIVSVFAGAWFAPAAMADTVQVQIGTATPEQGIPVAISFLGNTSSIDNSGDGSTLYGVVRPAGGIGCQSNFDDDQAAAGSASTVVTGDFGENGTSESAGPVQTSETFNPPNTGPYLVCAWLENPNNSNSVVAGPASATFSARGPQVSELNVALPTPAKPGVAFQINYTTQTDQQLTLDSAVKAAGGLPCASSYELEQQQNQTEDDPFGYDDNTSVFGGPILSTATDTETYGSYLICTWIEGPNNSEVDAAATTPIFVGTPPAPPAPPAPTRGSPRLQITSARVSRRHGASVHGAAAAGLSGLVAVGATCGDSTFTSRVTASNGGFFAHLNLPRSCRRHSHVKISANWHGSSSFRPESVSEVVRIGR